MVAFSSSGWDYGKELQKAMIAWNEAQAITSAINTNAIAYTVPAGTTVNGASFASPGTYTWLTTTSTTGGNVATQDTIAEALFVLKPKLRKKYKGDKQAFITDLLWAAEHKLQENATDMLDELLGIE